jgi:small subunit ribosomal protein S7
VRPRRSTTLPIRWVVDFARARREKSMAECLAGELMDAANGLGAAMKKRDDTQKMAESNRGFAHYRF